MAFKRRNTILRGFQFRYLFGRLAHLADSALPVIQSPQFQISAFERGIETDRSSRIAARLRRTSPDQRQSFTESERAIRAFRLLPRGLPAKVYPSRTPASSIASQRVPAGRIFRQLRHRNRFQPMKSVLADRAASLACDRDQARESQVALPEFRRRLDPGRELLRTRLPDFARDSGRRTMR